MSEIGETTDQKSQFLQLFSTGGSNKRKLKQIDKSASERAQLVESCEKRPLFRFSENVHLDSL